MCEAAEEDVVVDVECSTELSAIPPLPMEPPPPTPQLFCLLISSMESLRLLPTLLPCCRWRLGDLLLVVTESRFG